MFHLSSILKLFAPAVGQEGVALVNLAATIGETAIDAVFRQLHQHATELAVKASNGDAAAADRFLLAKAGLAALDAVKPGLADAAMKAQQALADSVGAVGAASPPSVTADHVAALVADGVSAALSAIGITPEILAAAKAKNASAAPAA